MNCFHSFKPSSLRPLFPQGDILAYSKIERHSSHVLCGRCSWVLNTCGDSASLWAGISHYLASSKDNVCSHNCTLIPFFLSSFCKVYSRVIYIFFLKYLWFLSTRNMVRYAYETADCDKMRFLDPCLTLLLFICLWTLCVPSPFPHILKEQTSGEGVTVLIAKVKPVFSSLFPPESLFPFKTKSILFIFVGVRKLVDIQAHASLEWWKVRANIFFFFWFYLDFCKEGTKPFTLKEALTVWWDGCSKW